MWKVETDNFWFDKGTEVYPIEKALKIAPDDYELQAWNRTRDKDNYFYGMNHNGDWCGIDKENCKQYFKIGDEVSFLVPQRGWIIDIDETGYLIGTYGSSRHLTAEELTLVKEDEELTKEEATAEAEKRG